MAESEEALQLKRRARRRLVGAIALVSFVVIILPLILDKEPGPAGPPLSVQIPSQESAGLNARGAAPALPAVAPPASEKKAETPLAKTETPAPKAEAPAAQSAAPAPKPAAPAAKIVAPASKPEPIAAPEPAKASAPAAAKTGEAQAALPDQTWVVMLEAFSDPKNVKQLRAKLSAAGVKSYTERVKTSKGELTRVRAGPFASKEAAEKARAKLDAMGVKTGAVASR